MIREKATKRNTRRLQRRGQVLLKLLLAVAVCSVLGVLFVNSPDTSEGEAEQNAGQFLVHAVERAEFVSVVTESGDVASASNVEVQCEVKSEGGAGTTILEVVEEGTLVKKGDFLVQLDDSSHQLALTQQEILVATDQAAVIEAQSELDKAVQTLNEYQDGLFLVDEETFESERFQAESHLKSAQDSFAHAEKMFRKGYVSSIQLEAERLAVEMASKAAQAAATKLRVHRQFTGPKMISEFKAEIEKQKANLTAAEYTLKLSQQRRDELSGQIAKCRILAPADGQVVYANEYRRSNSVIIEEGSQIREGQVIIRLPDPTHMQVDMRISDSKVNLLSVGNPVDIQLDVDPDVPVRGRLAEIAPFPFPREWKGAPIEYGAVIEVDDPPRGMVPGQRAKVHIFVERRENVLQAPIQSVVGRDGRHYCLVKDSESQWSVRRVKIGPSNDSFVVAESGLKEGELVALNPDLLWDDVAGELPEDGDQASPPAELASRPIGS